MEKTKCIFRNDNQNTMIWIPIKYLREQTKMQLPHEIAYASNTYMCLPSALTSSKFYCLIWSLDTSVVVSHGQISESCAITFPICRRTCLTLLLNVLSGFIIGRRPGSNAEGHWCPAATDIVDTGPDDTPLSGNPSWKPVSSYIRLSWGGLRLRNPPRP